MASDIGSIKSIRKKLGMTQHELARKSNVSQSLIAKLESGKLDPAYSKYKKIKDTLDMVTKKIEKKASEIMHKKVISVASDVKLRDVARVMRKHDISQVPVVDNGIIVGLVSESEVLDNLAEADMLTVGEVMVPPPPQLPPDAALSVIKSLLCTTLLC